MPLIICECGAEFLLIPDVEEKGHVIYSHSLHHLIGEEKPVLPEAKFRHIQDVD